MKAYINFLAFSMNQPNSNSSSVAKFVRQMLQ